MKKTIINFIITLFLALSPFLAYAQPAMPVIKLTVLSEYGQISIVQAVLEHGYPSIEILDVDILEQNWYWLRLLSAERQIISSLRFEIPLVIAYAPPPEGVEDDFPPEIIADIKEEVVAVAYDPRARYAVVLSPNEDILAEYDLDETIANCGDGLCSAGETPENCPQDCAKEVGINIKEILQDCGDGVCTPPETAQNCPQDCADPKSGSGPATEQAPGRLGVNKILIASAFFAAITIIIGLSIYLLKKRKNGSEI